MGRRSSGLAYGQAVAGPIVWPNASGFFDVQAVGITWTDIAAPVNMRAIVPASANRGFLFRVKLPVVAQTGTAAAGSSLIVQASITDDANNQLDVDSHTFQQGTAAANLFLHAALLLEAFLPAPVAAGAVKLRAHLAAAAPANWSTVRIVPGYGNPTSVPFYGVGA